MKALRALVIGIVGLIMTAGLAYSAPKDSRYTEEPEVGIEPPEWRVPLEPPDQEPEKPGRPKMRRPYGHDKDSGRMKNKRGRPIR